MREYEALGQLRQDEPAYIGQMSFRIHHRNSQGGARERSIRAEGKERRAEKRWGGSFTCPSLSKQLN